MKSEKKGEDRSSPYAPFDWDKDTPLKEAVMQAVGAASMCWEHVEGAGVFDSDRAVRVGDLLVAFIQDGIDQALSEQWKTPL